MLYLLAGARWDIGRALGITAVVTMRLAAQAAAVRLLGGQLTAVRVHALGGDVCWSGETRPMHRSWLAIASLLGVVGIWAVAETLRARSMPAMRNPAAVVAGIIAAARLLLATHLLPFWPLDGYDLWRTPLRALERHAVQRERQRLSQPRATPSPPAVTTIDPEVAEAQAALARAWQEARKPTPPSGD